MTRRTRAPREIRIDGGLTITLDPDGTLVDRTPIGEIHHVGIWGTRRTVTADHNLGIGKFPTRQYGLRRALWDAAAGHVAGFRARDIAYFVITRSLSPTIYARALKWERRRHRTTTHPARAAA